MLRAIQWMLGLVTVALLALACSDAAPARDDGEEDLRDAMPPMATLADSGTGPVAPGSRELEIEGQLNRLVFFGETIDLPVKLVEGAQRRPVGNERITAAVVDAQNQDQALGIEGTGLRVTTKTTDINGKVVFEMQSRMDARPVTFRVRAQATGAAPVFWNITVSRPGAGGLVVKVLYDVAQNRYGFVDFQEARATLFTNQTCAQLDREPTMLPPAYLGLPPIRPFNEIDNQASVSDLDAGVTFAVVAQGISLGGGVIAHGCVDGQEIVGGEITSVEVPIEDLQLLFKGVFLVENRLHLTGLLDDPDNGNETLRIVGRVLRVVAAIGGGVGEPNDPYPRGTAVVEEICELADLSDGVCQVVRALAPALVHNLIEEYVPTAVLDVLDVIGDIYRIVDDFTIIGEIEFVTQYPDENNQLLSNDNRWLKFRFVWRRGCPFNTIEECTREFSVGELGMDRRTIAGGFNAELHGLDELYIQPHSMTLRYGLIILGIAQQWIIPAILGVNGPVTIEELLGDLIPCADINAALPGGNPNSGICEDVLVTALGRLLVDQLGRLDFDADAFVLEGVTEPVDSDGDLTIDRLEEGSWDATIDIGDDGLHFDGEFVGCRRAAPGQPCTLPMLP